jgi:membrane protease YdiL (CAAX protease family)
MGEMEGPLNISGREPSKKVQAVEAAVFLLLIIPWMLISSAVAQPKHFTFPLVAMSTILSDIPLLFLVLYFLWRNGESFSSIGFTLRKGSTEAAIGAVLFVPLMFGMGLIEKVLRAAGLSVPHTPPSFLVPSGAGQVALALFLLVVVAVSEEVIFRGYLIRRFTVLSGYPAAALAFSSAVFAIGHGYERSGGMVGVGILGLIFGAVYLWRKSLVAPMVMHFIQNFIGIILISSANS